MVKQALKMLGKSFLRGSPTSPIFIKLKFGTKSLKAELLTIGSNPSERLKCVTLVLNPEDHNLDDFLKVVCMPSDWRAIAEAEIIRDSEGDFVKRSWEITGFDTEFEVHCRNGKDRFDAVATLSRRSDQLAA